MSQNNNRESAATNNGDRMIEKTQDRKRKNTQLIFKKTESSE